MCLAPFVQRVGKELLLESLQSQLDVFTQDSTDSADSQYALYMPKTHAFLCKQLVVDGDASGSCVVPEELVKFLEENCGISGRIVVGDIGTKSNVDRALTAHGFCLLLKSPVDLASYEVEMFLECSWSVLGYSSLCCMILTSCCMSCICCCYRVRITCRRHLYGTRRGCPRFVMPSML